MTIELLFPKSINTIGHRGQLPGAMMMMMMMAMVAL